jgi:hypothetical protein
MNTYGLTRLLSRTLRIVHTLVDQEAPTVGRHVAGYVRDMADRTEMRRVAES